MLKFITVYFEARLAKTKNVKDIKTYYFVKNNGSRLSNVQVIQTKRQAPNLKNISKICNTCPDL